MTRLLLKRILIGITPAIFSLFIGCSSGDSSQPPPQTGGVSEQSLKNLQCVAQDTQAICCQQMSQTMAYYYPYCAQSVQPVQTTSSSGYALPTTQVSPPPAPPQQAMTVPVPQGCAPQTNPMTCSQAMNNFTLQFNTTYNPQGQGVPAQAQQWENNQAAALMNCVNSSFSQPYTSTSTAMSDPVLMCQVTLTQQALNIPSTAVAQVPGYPAPTAVTTTTTVSTSTAVAPPALPPPSGTTVTTTSSQVVVLDPNSIPAGL